MLLNLNKKMALIFLHTFFNQFSISESLDSAVQYILSTEVRRLLSTGEKNNKSIIR